MCGDSRGFVPRQHIKGDPCNVKNKYCTTWWTPSCFTQSYLLVIQLATMTNNKPWLHWPTIVLTSHSNWLHAVGPHTWLTSLPHFFLLLEEAPLFLEKKLCKVRLPLLESEALAALAGLRMDGLEGLDEGLFFMLFIGDMRFMGDLRGLRFAMNLTQSLYGMIKPGSLICFITLLGNVTGGIAPGLTQVFPRFCHPPSRNIPSLKAPHGSLSQPKLALWFFISR